MNRLLLVGLFALTGCNQAPLDASEEAASALSGSSRELAAVASESGSEPLQYCEFFLGEPIPAGKAMVAKEVVPTEGDERVFYTYRACDDTQLVKIELVDNIVDSIEVSGLGNCISSIACVGDKYKEVLDRNPNAKLFLSQVDGATFSLIVGEQVTVRFNPNDIAKPCYDAPNTCEKAIHDSKVSGLFLHR